MHFLQSGRAFFGALVVSGLAFAAQFAASPAAAQVFGPPMTIFGSVTDSAGDLPEDLVVEAYIGDKVCGKGKTQFTGDGSGRVTVYFADVVSREQTAGCGSDGAEVRVRIGDRFGAQTARWRPGPAQLDITFGNATPRAIPTFTPTPRPQTPAAATPTPGGPTLTPGRPTAAVSVSPGSSPSASPSATNTLTATPTLKGGLSIGPGGSQTDGGGGGDSGFPVWGIVAIALGGLALIGGGAGWAMARRRGGEDIAELPVE